MTTYIFFRQEGWYPVELGSDIEVMANVDLNPGTLHVVRIEPGRARAIWTADGPEGETAALRANAALTPQER